MDTELLTAYTLRIGVILSIILIISGVALTVATGSTLGYSADELADPHGSVNTGTINYELIYHGLAKFEGLSFIILGLATLMATPIIRVILSVAAFALEGDKLYLTITSIVLIIILTAMFLAPELTLEGG